MKTTFMATTASIFSVLILLIISTDARSIRTKRQSSAMHSFNRRRRDLWEAYHRLEIIYNIIRSQKSVKYVPTSVEGDGGSTKGRDAMSIISGVLGPDFPTIFDDAQTTHMKTMDNAVRESLGHNAPRYNPRIGPHTAPDSEIEISNSNTLNSNSLHLARSYSGNGLVLKVVTSDFEPTKSRKKNTKTTDEIIHLCGLINRELTDKSLKLKCEVILENTSS